MRRLYSYIRFSTPEQAAGSSTTRQTEFAERYAAENGLYLDTSLTLRDEGLSAYHQNHIKQGALGAFLRAIENGQVEPGSLLVIEALDRLSRAEPIEAQALLYQIINAGITVVTASDGKHYDRTSLKSNPMDLVYSLLVMIRAHEESETKAKRVSASIRIACENWISGKVRTHIRNGRAPEWLEETGNDAPPLFRVIPERVEALRLAIEMYLSGQGAGAIVKKLNREKITYTGRPLLSSHLYKVIQAKTLMGIKEISVKGETYLLHDYYPAVLNQTEFDKLQAAKGNRPRASTSTIPGVITGQAICYCGYCGANMSGINMQSRARADGSISDGHRRLICASQSLRQDCPVGGSCSLAVVERALLTYCRDHLTLHELDSDNTVKTKLQTELAKAEAELAEIGKKSARLTEALLETDEPPLTIMRTMRELEKRQGELTAQCKQLGSELRTLQSNSSAKLLKEWSNVVANVTSLDYEARNTARSLCGRTFERVDVFIKGMEANTHGAQAKVAMSLGSRLGKDGTKKPLIDLVLRFKGGAVRLLRINPNNGKWVAQVDF
ncbi:recombinase family protein [Thalassolituus marinus]|uniref:Recombinase family protein n=1 Tax=Thalassolituus marinus TaxID=671053 RepID=A0ABS7ZMG4_9GAMM|nr:recombinase family protein [Thalassolituus marinus]MCA6062906.1 recombinase family protein [Thalassolituus marinus]